MGGRGRLPGAGPARLFRALDLADKRQRLFVVLRRPIESLAELVADEDRLDMELVGQPADPEARRAVICCTCWPAGRSPNSMPASWKRWPRSTAQS